MPEVTATVTGISRKEGVSKKTNKPWTKYIVETDAGPFNTFDAALYNQAQAAVGSRARVLFNEGGYGNDLVSLEVQANLPTPGAATPQTAPAQPAVAVREAGPPNWDEIGLRKTRCALWAALLSGPLLNGLAAEEAATLGELLVWRAEQDVYTRALPAAVDPNQEQFPF